jgi:hypothetical protein
VHRRHDEDMLLRKKHSSRGDVFFGGNTGACWAYCCWFGYCICMPGYGCTCGCQRMRQYLLFCWRVAAGSILSTIPAGMVQPLTEYGWCSWEWVHVLIGMCMVVAKRDIAMHGRIARIIYIQPVVVVVAVVVEGSRMPVAVEHRPEVAEHMPEVAEHMPAAVAGSHRDSRNSCFPFCGQTRWSEASRHWGSRISRGFWQLSEGDLRGEGNSTW